MKTRVSTSTKFGSYIAAKRKKAMSQCALAKQLEIHPTYLSKIERQGIIPSLHLVQKMARILNFDLQEALLLAYPGRNLPEVVNITTEYGTISQQEFDIIKKYRDFDQERRDFLLQTVDVLKKGQDRFNDEKILRTQYRQSYQPGQTLQ